jgi:NAD(P)-dependent dehydrogenase (short-subunit alcohol dehydrogenase family)
LTAKRLTDKVTLITGGGTGIGAAIAAQFAQEGAQVAICGRRPGPLAVTAGRIEEETGVEVLTVAGDIYADADGIVQRTVDHFGHLDILINNAAISAGVTVDEMGYGEWRQVIGVNLDAVFQLVRAALPHLAGRRGNVLHISSISAVSGEFDDVAYAASKAGLEGFSRRLALELAPQGMRSNVIRPGLIRTEAFDRMPDEFFQAQVPLIPLNRIGQPEDIARAAAFLCSSDAEFITGTVLTIDGGESAK